MIFAKICVCNVHIFTIRYPGLKPPMVGGIDLVGKVIETKSDSLKVRVSIRLDIYIVSHQVAPIMTYLDRQKTSYY